MRTLILMTCVAGCSNNEPQYVQCPMPMPGVCSDTELARFTADADAPAAGALHVPVLPEAAWKADDRRRRPELQMGLDPAVVVPIYRLEHYDLSVEWVVRNLAPAMGKFRIDLNGANEVAAYDNSMIMRGDPDDPPPPPLAGDIPFEIGPMATVTGVFREDQLREAAIDLDQITRGEVNPFAALLTINKQDTSFQPRTPTVYDPVTGDSTGGDPTGPAVPEVAWRQLVRVDINFRPDRLMEIEFALRLRVHTEVIHEEGLNAMAGEIMLYDPPYYVVTLP